MPEFHIDDYIDSYVYHPIKANGDVGDDVELVARVVVAEPLDWDKATGQPSVVVGKTCGFAGCGNSEVGNLGITTTHEQRNLRLCSKARRFPTLSIGLQGG